METKASINAITSLLESLVVNRDPGFFNFVARTEGGTRGYPRLRMVHDHCNIERNGEDRIARINILAQGVSGEGPFLFVWTPEESVDPNHAACNGMPLAGIVASA